MRNTLENDLPIHKSEIDIPIYRSRKYEYVRISDLPDEFARLELERWIFGKIQPLIQGEKGTIQDAVFLEDWKEFKKYRRGEYSKVN